MSVLLQTFLGESTGGTEILKPDRLTVCRARRWSKPCREGLGNIHCSGFYDVRSPDSILVAVQCDHGGQRLGCVDFDLVVPLSARFYLGRNCRALRQDCGTSSI